MKSPSFLTSIMAILLSLTGCDRGLTKTYPIQGVVRSLDQASGEVVISHEEIVGFMPKMTMPFSVQHRQMLGTIKPGDTVVGTLRVVKEGDSVKELSLIELKLLSRSNRVIQEPSSAPLIPSDLLKAGDLVPDFTMTTQDGKSLKLADLRGKVVVLSFIYTRCPSPEFCPAMDAKFADLARRIGAVAGRAEAVRLLSISFDPEHDTPEVLTAHAGRRGAKPPLWTFAVASHEELSKVAGPLGLTYVEGTREIDHNLRAALIGADGRLEAIEVGPGWQPSELVKAIYRLIPASKK